MRNLFFGLLLILLSGISVLAQEPISLADRGQIYDIYSQAKTFDDPSGKLTIQDILQPEIQAGFIDSKKEKKNRGYSRNAVWLKFSVKNQSADKQKWILRHDYPLTDYVSLFITSGNEVVWEKKLGANYPFKQRDIKAKAFTSYLNFLPEEEKTCYVRLSTQGTLVLDLDILSLEKLFEIDHIEQILWGIYIGGIVLLVLCFLIIFIYLKEKNYGYYVAFIVVYTSFELTNNNVAFEYLWPAYPLIAEKTPVVFLLLALVAGGLFTGLFLKPVMNGSLLYRVHYKLIYLNAVLSLIVCFLPFWIAIKISNIMAGISIIVISINTLMGYWRGYRPAGYLFLAWSVIFIGGIVNILRAFGIVPNTFVTQHSGQIGTLITCILMSVALSSRVSLLREEKEQAANALVEANKELGKYAQGLETMVKERTANLRKKNEELESAYIQIKKQEVKIVQQEKLAMIGDVVASVAHEVTTPLLAVMMEFEAMINYLHLLREAYSQLNQKSKIINPKFNEYHETLPQNVELINNSLKQIDQHIDCLKSFIRYNQGQQLFDINECIQTTLSIMKFKILSHVAIEPRLEKVAQLKGDVGQINQVLMNLLSNAIEAMPKDRKGVVNIRTHQENQDIIIVIEDNGIGIKKEYADKIFIERFTTKSNGTGLGLSICKEIIDKHGWNINFVTREGEGTVFTIKARVVNK